MFCECFLFNYVHIVLPLLVDICRLCCAELKKAAVVQMRLIMQAHVAMVEYLVKYDYIKNQCAKSNGLDAYTPFNTVKFVSITLDSVAV